MSRAAPRAFDSVKPSPPPPPSPSSSSCCRQSALPCRRRHHRPQPQQDAQQEHGPHNPVAPTTTNTHDDAHRQHDQYHQPHPNLEHPPPQHSAAPLQQHPYDAPTPSHPPSHPSSPEHQNVATPPQKRLLLPPLQPSTPRKRCRMNPYFTPIPNTPFYTTPLHPTQPQEQQPQPHQQQQQQQQQPQQQRQEQQQQQQRHHPQSPHSQQHLKPPPPPPPQQQLEHDQLPNLTSTVSQQQQHQPGLHQTPMALPCASNPSASASTYTLHPHAHLYTPLLSQQQHMSYHPHPQHLHAPPPVYTTNYAVPQNPHQPSTLSHQSVGETPATNNNTTNTAHDRKPADMLHSVLSQSSTFATTPSSVDAMGITQSILLLPPPTQASAPSLPLPVPLSLPLSLPLPLSLQVPLSLPPLAEDTNSHICRHVQSQLMAQAQSHIHSFAQSLTQPLTQPQHQTLQHVDTQKPHQQQQQNSEFSHGKSNNAHQSQPSFPHHDHQQQTHQDSNNTWLSDHERLSYHNQYHQYQHGHAYPSQQQHQSVAQNNFVNWLSDRSNTYDRTTHNFAQGNICESSSGNAIIDAHLRTIQQKASNILSSQPIPASACSSLLASQQPMHSQFAIPSVSVPTASSASAPTSTAMEGEVELASQLPSTWNANHTMNNFRSSSKRMRVGDFDNDKDKSTVNLARVSKIAKTGAAMDHEIDETALRSGVQDIGADDNSHIQPHVSNFTLQQKHIYDIPSHPNNANCGEDSDSINIANRYLNKNADPANSHENVSNLNMKGQIIDENEAQSLKREGLTNAVLSNNRGMTGLGSEVVRTTGVTTNIAPSTAGDSSSAVVGETDATRRDVVNQSTTLAAPAATASTGNGGIAMTTGNNNSSRVGAGAGAVVSNGLGRVQGKAVKSRDDRNGHLIFKLGEGLDANKDFPNGRYKILNELGEGTFGKVVECWDRLELRRVAIKVVRSINKYRQAARLEIDVLLHLNVNDPRGIFHCVKLFSWFEFHSHVCMVFEKLGPSLYDHLRRNHFRPFTLNQVRDYAFQLLESVNFVHSLTLIHTDLKPENILLASAKDRWAGARPINSLSHHQQQEQQTQSHCVHSCHRLHTQLHHQVVATDTHPQHHHRHSGATAGAVESGSQNGDTTMSENSSAGGTATGGGSGGGGACANGCMCGQRCCGWMNNPIKLIDFGSATYEAHHHSQLISTRHYRAPEVILGLGWTYPCDLWSIGCILVELYTGQALFQTHENLEHLAMMSHVLGPIPESMIRRTAGQQGQKYFRNKGGRKSLNWPGGATSKSSIHSVRSVQSLDRIIPREIGHDEFRDLVEKLLAFEPHTRYTTSEALRHPFFRNMTHCHPYASGGGAHGNGYGQHVWSPRSGLLHSAWDASAGLMSTNSAHGPTTTTTTTTTTTATTGEGGVRKSKAQSKIDTNKAIRNNNSNKKGVAEEATIATSATATELVVAQNHSDTGTGRSDGVEETVVKVVEKLITNNDSDKCDSVNNKKNTPNSGEVGKVQGAQEEEEDIGDVDDVLEVDDDEDDEDDEDEDDDDDDDDGDAGASGSDKNRDGAQRITGQTAADADEFVHMLNKNNWTLPVVLPPHGDVAQNNNNNGSTTAGHIMTQQVW